VSWDTELLPVPEIAYKADYYNDCEDAIVAVLEADGYTSTTTGDGGIQMIAARPFSMGEIENLFSGLTADEVPAIFVHAEGKGEDDPEAGAGEWYMPINVLVAIVQGACDLITLDNNTKRRLAEVERVMRQKAGSTSSGFWNNTEVLIGPSILMIGTEPDEVYRGVGWLQVTVKKRVQNRLEAL